MSITSIIEEPEGRELFAEHVRRPPVQPTKPILVPPMATPPNWTGQAFDYAFRLGYAKRWPKASRHHGTIADQAVERVSEELGRRHTLAIKTRARRDRGVAALAGLGGGGLTREQAEGCFDLGVLEVIGRGGNIIKFAGELDRVVTHVHIDELIALYDLIDWEAFAPKRRAWLNPTFGEGSALVGGTDADLVVDDLLVDFKVVKDAKLQARYVRQLVGYAILASEYGVDGRGGAKVNRLGVWFARSGELVAWSLDECVSEDGRAAIFDYFDETGQLR